MSSAEPIGVAFVEVVPETARFAALTETQLTRQLAATRLPVPVGPSTAAATRGLGALTAAQTEATTAATLLTEAQGRYDAALTAGAGLESRVAKAHVEAAAAAEADAAAKRALFAVTEQTDAALVAEIETLVTATAELNAKAAAEGRAALLTGVHSKASREAADAVLVESASMTGLRGASLGVNPAFLAATAASIAFFKSLEEASHFEHQMHQIQAATGATEEEMKGASQTAIAYGRDITLPGTSAIQSAEAINQMTHAGFTLTESEQGARAALLLHSAANVDLATSTTTITRLLHAYGLEVSDAGKVTDVLVAGSLSGAGSADEFGAALQRLSPVAHSMGLTLDDVATLLIQFGHAGVGAGEAATVIRQAFSRLASGSKPVQEGLAQVHLRLRDLRDEQGRLRPDALLRIGNAVRDLDTVQRQQVLSQIFSARGAARLFPLLDQDAAAYRRATRAAQEHGIAQRHAEDNAKGLSGRTRELKGDISDLGVQFGEISQGPATLFVDSLDRIVVGMEDIILLGDATVGTIEKLGKGFEKHVPGASRFFGVVKTGLSGFAHNALLGQFGPILDLTHKLALGAGALQGAFNHEKDSTTAVDAATAHLDSTLTGFGSTVDTVNTKVGTFTGTLETQGAVLEATGASQASQLANARAQRQAALQRLARDRARLARDPTAFGTKQGAGDARIAADAAAVTAARGKVNAILGDQSATAQRQASAAQAAADKIVQANNDHDQAVLTSIGSREDRLTGAVEAAASGSLRKQAAAERALRRFYNSAVAEVRRTVHDSDTAAAEIQSLRLKANAATREIARINQERIDNAKKAADTARQNAIEAAQLDEQILETRFGQDPSGSQTSRLIAAHNRTIAALVEARKHTQARSVEYKRLTLEIEQERAAIRDLKKAMGTDATQNFGAQAVAFLQAQQGFASQLAGNLLGDTSALNLTTTTAAGFGTIKPTPGGTNVFGGLDTSPTGGPGGLGGRTRTTAAAMQARQDAGRPASQGQMSTLISQSRTTNKLLSRIVHGLGHPEAEKSRKQQTHTVHTGVE